MQNHRTFNQKASRHPALNKDWKEIKSKAFDLCTKSNNKKILRNSETEVDEQTKQQYTDLKNEFDKLFLDFRNDCMVQGLPCPFDCEYDICRTAD